MEYLLSLQEIKGISYEGYYMSCNLDHALYGLMNLSDEEKKNKQIVSIWHFGSIQNYFFHF